MIPAQNHALRKKNMLRNYFPAATLWKGYHSILAFSKQISLKRLNSCSSSHIHSSGVAALRDDFKWCTAFYDLLQSYCTGIFTWTLVINSWLDFNSVRLGVMTGVTSKTKPAPASSATLIPAALALIGFKGETHQTGRSGFSIKFVAWFTFKGAGVGLYFIKPKETASGSVNRVIRWNRLIWECLSPAQQSRVPSNAAACADPL